MAEALSRSADYRVLRRLVPRTPASPVAGQETRIGILLDTETTGLDHRKDEIIELGMVKFDYLPDGRIVGVRDTFAAFNEPSAPIPPEITAITGITDEMVAGQRIDDAFVSAFVDDAVITIAHNSGFDRKFAGALSADLRAEGLGLQRDRNRLAKAQLRRRATWLPADGGGLLPSRSSRHRRLPRPAGNPRIRTADHDCAGARAVAGDGTQEDRARLAEQSPFELKDSLKRRGYCWSDGSDGRPRSWYADIEEAALDAELAFLKAEVYLCDVQPRLQTLTAFTRFSAADTQTSSFAQLRADCRGARSPSRMTIPEHFC